MKYLCSNCGKEVEKVYDMFADGMVLYCKECALKFIEANKQYKVNYPVQYRKITGEE